MKKREMGLGIKKAVVSAMMAVLLMQSLGEAAGGVTAAEAAQAAVVKTERSLYKGTETAGPAAPRATSKAEKEEVPGRLIQRRYEAYYRLNNGKKAKKKFITINDKTYYFDRKGKMYHGWLKKGKKYHYMDRETGVMVYHGKVDGIRIKKGCAVKTKLNCRKIETMRTASRIVRRITKPSDSIEKKRMKCYKYIIKFPYRRYRLLKTRYKKKGWESTFANDIFKHHAGCCVSTASALAFMFHEIGYKKVYVAFDTSHAWVELNGKVYDSLFSEAKDFWKYYGGTYKSCRLHRVGRRKI